MLEQRWNEKLETVERIKTELDVDDDIHQTLSPAERETIIKLGRNFSTVWNDSSCSMVLLDETVIVKPGEKIPVDGVV